MWLTLYCILSFIIARYAIDQLQDDVKTLKEKVENVEKQVTAAEEYQDEPLNEFIKVYKAYLDKYQSFIRR